MAGQNTLAATPFNPAIQKWIATNADYINRLAAALNIPAAAIAGAPAEKRRTWSA
jgi:lysophospholipase L1-like esterase